MQLYINDYYNFFHNGQIQTGKLISINKKSLTLDGIETEVNVVDIDGKEIEIDKSIKMFPSAFKQHIYESINTYRDTSIEAIISRAELMDVYNKINPDCVLIYINEPDDEIEQLNYFSDELYVSFYGLSSSMNGYDAVSKDVIDDIMKFRYKNSGKKFVIACSTGVTKSASLAAFLFKIRAELKEFSRYFVNNELVDHFDILHYGKKDISSETENFKKIKAQYKNYVNKIDEDEDELEDDDSDY